MRVTRREVGKLALAGLAARHVLGSRVSADTRFGGVLVGVQSYSFRSIPDANAIVAAMKDMGISAVELMSNHAESLAGAPSGRAGGPGAGGQGRGGRGRGAELTPEQQAAQQAARAAQAGAQEELRRWRAATTDATWQRVRKTIADAGVDLRFVTCNMNVNTTTDEDVDYAFRMARALGVTAITSSTQISMAKRLVPFVEKYRMPFAFHGHADVTNPDETSTEATFEAALAVHPLFRANLDIGHYVVAGGDPVAFIRKHHERITNLHLKDRTRAGGNVAFGTGETPIKEVLLLLKSTKWDIPANIEFEYQGDPLVEVPKCIQYCKDALT